MKRTWGSIKQLAAGRAGGKAKGGERTERTQGKRMSMNEERGGAKSIRVKDMMGGGRRKSSSRGRPDGARRGRLAWGAHTLEREGRRACREQAQRSGAPRRHQHCGTVVQRQCLGGGRPNSCRGGVGKCALSLRGMAVGGRERIGGQK